MGVDYYTCGNCGNNFPDCSDYCIFCDCGNLFCSSECAEMRHTDTGELADLESIELRTDDKNCCICRKEVANDYILLETLLRHYKLTREDVFKMWQQEQDVEENHGE